MGINLQGLSQIQSYVNWNKRSIMQTVMIRIALMLCLLECAFAYSIPIQKEIVGQEDEGQNIMVHVPVGNRQGPKCRESVMICDHDDQCCNGLHCHRKKKRAPRRCIRIKLKQG